MFENKLPLIPKLPALRIRGMWIAENWRTALSTLHFWPPDTYTLMHVLVDTHSVSKKYSASGRCLSFSKLHRQ